MTRTPSPTNAQSPRQRKPFHRFNDTLTRSAARRAAWFGVQRQAMAAIARRRGEDHHVWPQAIVRHET
jgi:hypothetical protein